MRPSTVINWELPVVDNFCMCISCSNHGDSLCSRTSMKFSLQKVPEPTGNLSPSAWSCLTAVAIEAHFCSFSEFLWWLFYILSVLLLCFFCITFAFFLSFLSEILQCPFCVPSVFLLNTCHVHLCHLCVRPVFVLSSFCVFPCIFSFSLIQCFLRCCSFVFLGLFLCSI